MNYWWTCGRRRNKRQTAVHKKYEQQKQMCSKFSAVIATANFQQKKQNKSLQISKQNCRRKASAKLWPMMHFTPELKRKCHLWRRKRERPALVDATCECECTELVYSTKGTTWLGSPPQSTQSAGPVRFLIFGSTSIILLASLVAGGKPQCSAGAL
jgi:hypothetical protein